MANKNISLGSIEFKGIQYPTRDLNVKINGELQTVTISTTNLSAELEKENFEGEAEIVDNQIYFFVSDDEIFELGIRALTKLVREETEAE